MFSLRPMTCISVSVRSGVRSNTWSYPARAVGTHRRFLAHVCFRVIEIRPGTTAVGADPPVADGATYVRFPPIAAGGRTARARVRGSPGPSSRSARQAIRSPLMAPAPPPIHVDRAPVLTLLGSHGRRAARLPARDSPDPRSVRRGIQCPRQGSAAGYQRREAGGGRTARTGSWVEAQAADAECYF